MKITSHRENITIEYNENSNNTASNSHQYKENAEAHSKNNSVEFNFSEFLTPKTSDINLKFTFDHIQNYGLSAGICAIGMFLFRKNFLASPIFDNDLLRYIIAAALILIGFIFFTLNITQGMIVILKTQKKNCAYYFYASSLFIVGITFFGSLISFTLKSASI